MKMNMKNTINPFISIEAHFYFKVLNAEMYGGTGSIGYNSVELKDIKDLEKLTDKFISDLKIRIADTFKVSVEDIKLISKDAYKAATEDSDDKDKDKDKNKCKYKDKCEYKDKCKCKGKDKDHDKGKDKDYEDDDWDDEDWD